MNFNNFLCLFLGLGILACGKSSDSKKEAPLTIKSINGLSASSLNGTTWEAKCATVSRKSDVKSDHRLKIFQVQGEIKFEWSFWPMTNDCQTAVGELKIKGEGIFSDEDLKQFNSLLKSAQFMPLHDVVSDAFNTNKNCGFSGWRTYDWKDILYSDCMRSDRGTLFFDQLGTDLILYSCDENEELSSNCERVKLTPVKD
jgi:hypothetical protein